MVILDKRESDYILGSSPVEKTIVNQYGDWQSFSPEHERQNIPVESLMCVSFSATDVIEYLFNEAIYNNRISLENLNWLREKGYFKNGKINFSERFVGALAETNKKGAYQYKVGDAIRKYGLIPNDIFTLTDSFEKNINKEEITQEMYDLGKEFIERFPINYEWVNDIDEGLKYGPLQVCVYYADGNGILCPGQNPQHAVVLVDNTEMYSLIDDSYITQFKKYCHKAIYSPMLYTVKFKKTMFTFKKVKGDKNIWICREDNKTRAVFLDEVSMNFFTDIFEEVDDLNGYESVGTQAIFSRTITD